MDRDDAEDAGGTGGNSDGVEEHMTGCGRAFYRYAQASIDMAVHMREKHSWPGTIAQIVQRLWLSSVNPLDPSNDAILEVLAIALTRRGYDVEVLAGVPGQGGTIH